MGACCAARDRGRTERRRLRSTGRCCGSGRGVRCLAACRRGVRALRVAVAAGTAHHHRGHRACGLHRRRRSQVAQRALRAASHLSGSPPGSVRHSACREPRISSDRTSREADPGCWGRSHRGGRALPIWATLAGYGRAGYPALVERHCDLASHLSAAADAAPDLERLAECRSTLSASAIVPQRLAEPELNDVSRRLAESLLDDGQVFAGGTVYGGRAAGRPCARRSATGAPRRPTLIFWSRLSASVAPTRPALADQAQLRRGEPWMISPSPGAGPDRGLSAPYADRGFEA